MNYENTLSAADGDRVMLHGRFRNAGQPSDVMVADIRDRRRSAR
jgi:hypothetical protein